MATKKQTQTLHGIAIYAYIDPPETTPTDRHLWRSHGAFGKKNTDVENRWHSSQWTLWSLTVRESIESNPSGGLAR